MRFIDVDGTKNFLKDFSVVVIKAFEFKVTLLKNFSRRKQSFASRQRKKIGKKLIQPETSWKENEAKVLLSFDDCKAIFREGTARKLD